MGLELLVGSAAALASLWITRSIYGARKMPKFWANGLVVVALIYVGFALLGNGHDWLWIELLGVVAYCLPLLLFRKWGSWTVGLGWLLHVLWDVLLHGDVAQTPFVPHWYPGVCIGFDVAIALYFFVAYFAKNE